MTPQILIQLLPLVVVLAALGLYVYFMRSKGYPERNGRIIVRCGQGHLFSTIWIPFVSLKAIRLGPVRFQFCPVGGHWALVMPVKKSDLTEEEKLIASQNRDSLIP